MHPDRKLQLAALLGGARSAGRQLASLAPELVPATHADGYSVNELVAQRLEWAPLGWKIAGTNQVMQQRLKTGQPIYGRTYARFETTSPAAFRHANLLDPIVECEFFFRLTSALPPRATPYTQADVALAVGSVHAGIEVAECRFPLAALPPMPAILADGAASGRYVVGSEISDWNSRDLATMSVTLAVNGITRRTGCGAEIMGDPIRALVWLANERSAWGDGLAAGALVSTGTATGMLLAKPGDVMQARFGDAWTVDVAFHA